MAVTDLDAYRRHRQPCARGDALTLADMQRRAGQSHDYPVSRPAPHVCAGCGQPLAKPLAVYCSRECVRRATARLGRYREGLQTSAEYSFPPPVVR